MSTSQDYSRPVQARGQGLLLFMVFFLLLGVAAALGGGWFIHQELLKTQRTLALSTPTEDVSEDLSRIEKAMNLYHGKIDTLVSFSAEDSRRDSIAQLEAHLAAIAQRMETLPLCEQKLDAANAALAELQGNISESQAQLTAISTTLSRQTTSPTPTGEIPTDAIVRALTVAVEKTFKETCGAASAKQLAKLELIDGKMQTALNTLNTFQQPEHHVTEMKLLESLSTRLDVILKTPREDATAGERAEMLASLRRVEASTKTLENMVTLDEYRKTNGRLETALIKLATLLTNLADGRKVDAEILKAVQAGMTNASTLIAAPPTRQQLHDLISSLSQVCSRMATQANSPNDPPDKTLTDELVRRISDVIQQHCGQMAAAPPGGELDEPQCCGASGPVMHVQLPLVNRVTPVALHGGRTPTFQFREQLPFMPDLRGLVLDSIEITADFPRGVLTEAEIDDRTNTVVVSVYWAGAQQMGIQLQNQIQHGQWSAHLELIRQVELAEMPVPLWPAPPWPRGPAPGTDANAPAITR